MVYLNDDIYGFDLDAALKDISKQRREQALKFKHEEGRRLCVLAYQLLKQGLFKEYGIKENPIFEYGEHGKPSIIGHPEIHFNLSHCCEAAVCAISPKPIGIDVERIRHYDRHLIDYTMNDTEIQAIETAADPDRHFIRLWTMKEALLKLTGQGIATDLKTVITPAYRFHTIERPMYIYSVCETINYERDKVAVK